MATSSNGNWFFDFMRKYGLVLLAMLFVLPWLIKYALKMLQSVKETAQNAHDDQVLVENQHYASQQQHADSIIANKEIQAVAQKLAHDLGTKYSDNGNWYDIFNPYGWTENDKAVADALIRWRLPGNLGLVQRLYAEVYTNQRNLHDDVLNYLDAGELARIRQYINW
jgi:hypothetical protein